MRLTPENYLSSVHNASSYIKEKVGDAKMPSICIVLGTGLSPLTEYLTDYTAIDYADIPDFPESTVMGHVGKLYIGSLEGKRVFMMSGRFHYYEGYDTSVCAFYVRVMRWLGVESIYFTNAAGGISSEMKPPELMIITDHISCFCESPLRGTNLEEFGVRFPDQTQVYDPEYIDKLEKIASDNGINIHKGVYAYSRGPQYETPAEIRALKVMGADAVGMSTVPEAIVASHCGMRIAAVSLISNYAAGITSQKLNHQDVIDSAAKASKASCELARLFVKSL